MMSQNMLLRFLAAFVFLGVLSCGPPTDGGHPSDASLLATFENNRDDFERLLTMCEEDSGMIRIASDFTWKKDNVSWPRPQSELGITNERWDTYRELFAKTQLRAGILNYQPNAVVFSASSQGLLTAGSSKGYEYRRTPPDKVVDSLDSYKFEKAEKVYRHIEGNWYLYFETTS